jgi:hypothetical protein
MVVPVRHLIPNPVPNPSQQPQSQHNDRTFESLSALKLLSSAAFISRDDWNSRRRPCLCRPSTRRPECGASPPPPK